MIDFLRVLVVEDQSQDLAEYALLAAFIAFAGLAAFSLIQTTIKGAYEYWDVSEQNLWEPPNPG